MDKSKPYYTIEKLPYRKSWSLNRMNPQENRLEVVAYFKTEDAALKTKKELAK